jgi:NADPH2:quinone reductase
MRAYQVPDLSIPPALTDIADPTPAQGAVLLDIAACGLNFADLLMAKGS